MISPPLSRSFEKSRRSSSLSILLTLALLILPLTIQAMPDTRGGQDRQVAAGIRYLDRAMSQLREGKEPEERHRRIFQGFWGSYVNTLKVRHNVENNYDFPEPDRTTHYINAVKMSFLHPGNHKGWPFGSKLSLAVKEELQKRLDEKYDPFLAFAALFPALSRKENSYAIATYEKLQETDPFLALKVIEWSATRLGSFDWLLGHYLKNGQQQLIDETIEKLAAIGTDECLCGAGALRSILGQPLAALEYLNKVKDPALRVNYLTSLYVHYQTTEDAAGNTFADRFYQLCDELFPGGVEEVTLADFTDPPKNGVVFTESSSVLISIGIKRGDVLVAVDGYRITNDEQFSMTVCRFPTKEEILLIFWDGKRYREVDARIPYRNFKAAFRTYKR